MQNLISWIGELVENGSNPTGFRTTSYNNCFTSSSNVFKNSTIEIFKHYLLGFLTCISHSWRGLVKTVQTFKACNVGGIGFSLKMLLTQSLQFRDSKSSM